MLPGHLLRTGQYVKDQSMVRNDEHYCHNWGKNYSASLLMSDKTVLLAGIMPVARVHKI